MMKKMMEAGKNGKVEDLLKPETKEEKKKEPRKQPKNPYGQASSLSEDEMITLMGVCSEVLAPFYRLLFAIMISRG